MKDAIVVSITGAAGQIGYQLMSSVAKGDVFGPDQPMILKLLDIEPMMSVLEGVVMEMRDCSFPLLKDIITTFDPEVAFKDCDAVFLVGAMPRKQGMERKDLLAANVKIFKVQGEALDKVAKKSVKVLVVGNPANTNSFICSYYAPSIPKENFSALTRLDQNRSMYQIGAKCGVGSECVKNVIIWGNHSATQYPDVRHATVNIGGTVKPVPEAVNDDHWLKNEFITTVQKRGAAVIAARKLSSAMSAAKASCDHMRDWWIGTKEGEWVSMAVCSDGSYEIEKGLMYSFPVTIKGGKWSIVQGLSIDDFSREKMTITMKELIGERDEALEVCKAS